MASFKADPIPSFKYIQALIKAGVVPPNTVGVVIEAKANSYVVIHYETVADNDSLLRVVPAQAEPPKVKTTSRSA